MILTSTEHALQHAETITEEERKHIEAHYRMIQFGLKELRESMTAEQKRQRAQFFLNAATKAQFLRECFQEFDRLQDEDRINAITLEVAE